MKPETILKKAIEKAVKNGCTAWVDWKRLGEDWWRGKEYYSIIFSHDFAKAFWNSTSCFHGGKEYRHQFSASFCKAPDKQAQWQHHLQQMVLEPDPILYLRMFL